MRRGISFGEYKRLRRVWQQHKRDKEKLAIQFSKLNKEQLDNYYAAQKKKQADDSINRLVSTKTYYIDIIDYPKIIV
jgi:predicted ATP-dependent endonuclease of OLD family